MTVSRIIPQLSDPVISFQMPIEMYEAIQQEAARQGASFETELLMRLGKSLQAPTKEGLSSAEWMELIFRPIAGESDTVFNTQF
jgi:hypothetical protein